MLSFPDFKEKQIIIVFTTEKQYFSFKNDNIIIKDNDDKVILQHTCYRILALWIVGHAAISSGLLERSKKFGFPVYMLTYNFRIIGLWNASTEGNFLLRKKQYDYNEWDIARHIVKNKIENQTSVLKNIRQKSVSCKEAIATMHLYKLKVDNMRTMHDIMGMEGIASRIYFDHCFAGLDWKGRKPRTKIDPINVYLDIGYTFLFYLVENMLNLYGFDVYQGVYHRNFYKRKSLVCDIQEPFRCIIDKQLKRSYGLGQIKEDDFIFEKGQYKLKYERTKEYTHCILNSILEYKADIFLYCQQYYRCFIRNQPIELYPTFEINNPITKNK